MGNGFGDQQDIIIYNDTSQVWSASIRCTSNFEKDDYYRIYQGGTERWRRDVNCPVSLTLRSNQTHTIQLPRRGATHSISEIVPTSLESQLEREKQTQRAQQQEQED